MVFTTILTREFIKYRGIVESILAITLISTLAIELTVASSLVINLTNTLVITIVSFLVSPVGIYPHWLAGSKIFGNWKLETGNWKLAESHWLAIGNWKSETGN